jgi:hypothetical protein
MAVTRAAAAERDFFSIDTFDADVVFLIPEFF